MKILDEVRRLHEQGRVRLSNLEQELEAVDSRAVDIRAEIKSLRTLLPALQSYGIPEIQEAPANEDED